MRRWHMGFCRCLTALINVSLVSPMQIIGFSLYLWKGQLQTPKVHHANCVKLIDRIQYFAPTQLAEHWSTDTTSWPRVDHMMRRTALNPRRSNNYRLWVAEWFICNDLNLPTLHVQMCYLNFNLDGHLHTTTRVVEIVVVAHFQQ